MKMPPLTRTLAAYRTERGFTLVELMVAMTVALFLLNGLVTILQGIRNTVQSQRQLSQLEDNERFAMTLIAEIVESAGYYPNPAANSAASTLTGTSAPSAFTSAGSPTIVGVANASAQGDTITNRYAAALNDNVFNCSGNQNTAVAGFDSWENTFSVNAQNQLACSVYSPVTNTTTTVPLVSGVQKMTISYGVNTLGTTSGSCVDTYKTSAQMTGVDWGNVCSVVVTLVFLNSAAPPGSPNTVTFTQVIPVMNTAGVNT